MAAVLIGAKHKMGASSSNFIVLKQKGCFGVCEMLFQRQKVPFWMLYSSINTTILRREGWILFF